jgi:uncharacterized protein
MGTVTWVQDPLDQVVDLNTHPEYRDYPDYLEQYSFRNAQGQYVLCWDRGRFVNHNCEANCLSPGLDFEICIRDIEAGTQLTNDYGSLNLEFTMDCHCGSAACRGVTQPDDFPRLAPGWDASLRVAFPHIALVEQPLWNRLKDPNFVKICLADPNRIPSILEHYYESTCLAARNGVSRSL